jgi:hypothetical protein
MSTQPSGLRQCPTRVDGNDALFAHLLTANQCRSRQRGLYHKCAGCELAEGLAAAPAGRDLIGATNGVVPRVRLQRPVERTVELKPVPPPVETPAEAPRRTAGAVG